MDHSFPLSPSSSSSFLGYKVRVLTSHDRFVEGIIFFVDPNSLQLKNVSSNDPSIGNRKEITIQSYDIKDLQVLEKPQGKPEEFAALEDLLTPENFKEKSSKEEAVAQTPGVNTQRVYVDPAIITMYNKGNFSRPTNSHFPPPPDPYKLLNIAPPQVELSEKKPREEKMANRASVVQQQTKNLSKKNLSPQRRSYAARDHATFSEKIQEQDLSEDFDFELSNARFNKHEVYQQMQEEFGLSRRYAQPKITSEDIPKHLFFNESKIQIPAVTGEKMTELYQLLKEEGFHPNQIMENSGRSLAQVALQYVGKKKKPKVIVLVGANCSGAIGICAARHLINHNINAIICKSRGYHLSQEVVHQEKLLKCANGKEAHVGSLPVEQVDLIIDALIGIGLKGAPKGPLVTLIQWANANGAPILSLETPTGLDPTTGQTPGEFIHAKATVALGLPKTGYVKQKVGKVYLCDIGIPASIISKIAIEYESPFYESYICKLSISTPQYL